MARSHHFTHPHQVSARLAPPLLWCAVPLVLPLRAHRRCYPRIGLVVNIIYIRRFCDHVNIVHTFDRTNRFEVNLELYDGLASSLVLLPCFRLTPRHHRQADGQLSPLYPPLAKFQLVWRRLCAASSAVFLLPRWSETPVSAASSSLKCRKYFAVNKNNKSSIIFAGTVWTRSQRRSQFEHDHRRTADRAPQITASFTRDKRRAHWHI